MESQKPQIGEMVYGCQHSGSACGPIATVSDHVTTDSFSHWKATEAWTGRDILVRRETNGQLYEVRVEINYRD